MVGVAPRQLVERHLAEGAGGAPTLRDVPPIELLLPPFGVHLVETVGDSEPPRGFAVDGDGHVHALHEADGLAGLLRSGVQLDPLALILVVARYRLPALTGVWPVNLVTSLTDLDPASVAVSPPLDLVVDDGDTAFTTEVHTPRADGRVHVRLDRWRLATGAASLDGDVLLDVTVPGAP